MHQVRGLVHRCSTAALRQVEKRVMPHDVTTCFADAAFVDSSGARSTVRLLHPAALQQLLGELPKAEAIHRVREAQALLTPAPSARGPELCVRGTTQRAVAELRGRQSRLLSKLEGRLMAHDLRLVEDFAQRLLVVGSWAESGEVSPNGPDLVAMYRGIVEELSQINSSAALAMALNVKLPLLGTGASAALAKLVNIDKPSATLSFLEGFAEKDEVTAASETCATQVAIRLRNKLWEMQGTGADDTKKVVLRESLAMACRFNIDPGAVFPTDAAAIQRWGSQFFRDDMWPLERSTVIFDIVRRKKLMPRRVSLDCLSNWCLTDLERAWVSCLLLNSEEAGGIESSNSAVYCSALSYVLKDPKRYLVDNRLLKKYAELLKNGDVEPTHSSFVHFIEECGECHSNSDGDNERPEELSFLLPFTDSSGSQTVMDALVALAPQSGYWRTLLSTKQEGIVVTLGPQGHVHVTIKLPRVHECVEAAMQVVKPSPSSSSSSSSFSFSFSSSLSPALPVIFEDEDIVVFSKPPHLASSRHALSCTQLGDATATDMVSLALASQERGKVMCGVFRQGQVHRLDAETSGCFVMAKTDRAAASLRHQMGTSAAYSQCCKVYMALCLVMEPDLAQIPLRGLLKDPLDPKITTKYRVVRFFKKSRVALLECRIQQGKKHQIRRHLAAAGLPILQDVEHGGAACCTPVIHRVALHASALTFVHPSTAVVVTAVAQLAGDFAEAINQLC